MKTFDQYVENKRLSCTASQIIENLVQISDYFAPEDVLEHVFCKQFGQSNHCCFVEAFGGQSGTWGNIGKGIMGGAKWLGGKAAQGIGGMMGGAAGAAAGGTMGAMGGDASKLGNLGGAAAGASAGSQPGANVAAATARSG